MLDAPIAKKKTEDLAWLLEDRVEIFVSTEQHNSSQNVDVGHQAKAHVARATRSMELAADTTINALQTLADSANKAGQTLRWAQVDLGIYRPLKKPDWLASTALIVVAWMSETIFASISLIDRLDVSLALGTAATFSTTMTGLGIAAGSCFRFVGFRKNSPARRSEHRLKSRLACFGFGSISCIAALLAYVGARVRVVGHENIFDFSKVGAFATYSDALSIIISISAALSFGVSVLKGRFGFADVPEYEDYAGAYNQDFDEDARKITENGFDDIDQISEDAELAIFEALGPEQDKDTLLEQVTRFNAAVENAKNELRAFAKYQWEQACFIAGEEVPKPKVSFSEYNKLLIDPAIIQDIKPCQHLFDELRHAQAEASAKVMNAHAEYVASVQSVRFLPPQFPTE